MVISQVHTLLMLSLQCYKPTKYGRIRSSQMLQVDKKYSIKRFARVTLYNMQNSNRSVPRLSDVLSEQKMYQHQFCSISIPQRQQTKFGKLLNISLYLMAEHKVPTLIDPTSKQFCLHFLRYQVYWDIVFQRLGVMEIIHPSFQIEIITLLQVQKQRMITVHSILNSLYQD